MKVILPSYPAPIGILMPTVGYCKWGTRVEQAAFANSRQFRRQGGNNVQIHLVCRLLSSVGISTESSLLYCRYSI